VRANDGFVPDWRDSAAYEPLLKADRSLVAWEWLRRTRDYGEAARASHAGAEPERWGLHAFEPPGLAVPIARPVWCAGRHPFVLSAWAEPSPPGPDSFLLETVGQFATLGAGPGVEWLLLSNGYRIVRLDVRGASLRCGPVRLSFHLSGIAGARSMLLVLRRFLALANRGGFPSSHYPRDPKARRLVLLLRAYDALLDGADQRMIAGELLSDRAAEKGWRLNAPSLRSQVQRLVRKARSMAACGFWNLLM
jgi:hypothetical protein